MIPLNADVQRPIDWGGRNVPFPLRRALAADLDDILVIGYDQDGELFICSSRGLKNDLALFLLESVKLHIMRNE